MDDGLMGDNEPLDYSIIDNEEVLEQKVSTKKKGKLNTKLPVDLCLFGSGLSTAVTGLLRKYGGRKYCKAHQTSVYFSLTFGTIHVYQHRHALIGYVKKKYQDARDWVDEAKEELSGRFGDDGTTP